jgi:hypothetical protein
MRPAQTPSLVAKVGYKGWYARDFMLLTGLTYIDGRYITPEPLFRTEHITRLCPTAEHYDALTHQNRLGGALYFDVFVGKKFYFGGHSLMISLAGQLLVAGDKTQYAYEQRRLLFEQGTNTFRQSPLKRLNAYPATAMLSISYTL